MITPEFARAQAIDFLTRQGLDRAFVENSSITIEDAQEIFNIVEAENPRKILEIGTFVGVSSAVLGLGAPQAEIVCIDADLPAIAQNLLCLRQFDDVRDRRTNLDFVSQVVEHFGMAKRFTLKSGFFSCCFPEDEDRNKLSVGEIELTGSIIGQEICEQFGPFDMAFLDADHRKAAVFSDLTVLYPHVKPGGAIVLDDAGEDFWGQQVKAAMREFLELHPEIPFEVRGDIGIIRRS
ncbi:MAG: O-methyltransferase [Hormoscilla sp.]